MSGSHPPGSAVASGPGVPDADEPAEQKRRVRAMFEAVARRYDFLNHLLSAGVDRRWRRRAVRALGPAPGQVVLDLCAGTGDLGLAVLEHEPGARVIGVDLARNMLVRGRAKSGDAGYLFVQGDGERLPLAEGSVDRVCVGFGIRNMPSVAVAAREVARVLRPGGRFVILEFTTPPRRVVRAAYAAYFHHLLPRIGGWVSGNGAAYRYLPDSVRRFPGPEALAGILAAAGFASVRHELLTGGIACLHTAER